MQRGKKAFNKQISTTTKTTHKLIKAKNKPTITAYKKAIDKNKLHTKIILQNSFLKIKK